MENKTNWWMILAIVIVVAVVASLITANFTGNVIKVNADKLGANKVYTKGEVDGLIKNLTSSIESHLAGKYHEYTLATVKDMLNNASVERVNDNLFENMNFSISCDQKCIQGTKICVASFVSNFGGSELDGSFKAVNTPIKCSEVVSKQTFGQLGGYSSIELVCVCA